MKFEAKRTYLGFREFGPYIISQSNEKVIVTIDTGTALMGEIILGVNTTFKHSFEDYTRVVNELKELGIITNNGTLCSLCDTLYEGKHECQYS